MEAEVPTVRVGATPTRLTVPPPPQPPQGFFTGQIPFLPPNQQHQSTEVTTYDLKVMKVMLGPILIAGR